MSLEKRLVAEAPTLLALIYVFKLDIHCRRMITLKSFAAEDRDQQRLPGGYYFLPFAKDGPM
ncbi:hypothetical protein K435DRAFT_881475 [Dendrothele bispora CBS 962.96]|uniref:Uncharacterized protein n=1 Tax=Dendrothele bispora (strain CBS 962.96) TaxID=1314807 RepID=A0A4S8KIH7_DENBC|nr:hypothetical protein K435DRAFT_881475 [Dendrothele bispora CBS 962.96]